MHGVDALLSIMEESHEGLCPGIILGTRMTIAGMRELGMNPAEKNRNLVVYVESDRCIADAIQAITRCTPGHRTLKYKPYGKFAATFMDMDTGKAVRVSVTEKIRVTPGQTDVRGVARTLLEVPESELIRVLPVNVVMQEEELPGTPGHKARCSVCGELVLDHKETVVGGNIMCKNCVEGSYYTKADA